MDADCIYACRIVHSPVQARRDFRQMHGEYLSQVRNSHDRTFTSNAEPTKVGCYMHTIGARASPSPARAGFGLHVVSHGSIAARHSQLQHVAGRQHAEHAPRACSR